MSTLVIKIGGDIVADNERLACVVDEVGALTKAGHRLIVVHGGGPQASALTRRLGIEPTIVGGLRVTSHDVLDVVKMTLGGQVSVDLAAAFRAKNVPALGLSSVSAGIVNAVKRPARVMMGCGDEPVDFGEVGDIVSVNSGVLETLLDAGLIPVLNSLGCSDSGRVLNINADVVACDIAISLGADALVLVTGADGVLAELSEPGTRFPELSVAAARALIEDGTVQGGMIPKLVESFRVIEKGVGRVIILSAARGNPVQSAVGGSRAFGTTLHL